MYTMRMEVRGGAGGRMDDGEAGNSGRTVEWGEAERRKPQGLILLVLVG